MFFAEGCPWGRSQDTKAGVQLLEGGDGEGRVQLRHLHQEEVGGLRRRRQAERHPHPLVCASHC